MAFPQHTRFINKNPEEFWGFYKDNHKSKTRSRQIFSERGHLDSAGNKKAGKEPHLETTDGDVVYVKKLGANEYTIAVAAPDLARRSDIRRSSQELLKYVQGAEPEDLSIISRTAVILENIQPKVVRRKNRPEQPPAPPEYQQEERRTPPRPKARSVSQRPPQPERQGNREEIPVRPLPRYQYIDRESPDEAGRGSGKNDSGYLGSGSDSESQPLPQRRRKQPRHVLPYRPVVSDTETEDEETAPKSRPVSKSRHRESPPASIPRPVRLRQPEEHPAPQFESRIPVSVQKRHVNAQRPASRVTLREQQPERPPVSRIPLPASRSAELFASAVLTPPPAPVPAEPVVQETVKAPDPRTVRRNKLAAMEQNVLNTVTFKGDTKQVLQKDFAHQTALLLDKTMQDNPHLTADAAQALVYGALINPAKGISWEVEDEVMLFDRLVVDPAKVQGTTSRSGLKANSLQVGYDDEESTNSSADTVTFDKSLFKQAAYKLKQHQLYQNTDSADVLSVQRQQTLKAANAIKAYCRKHTIDSREFSPFMAMPVLVSERVQRLVFDQDGTMRDGTLPAREDDWKQAQKLKEDMDDLWAIGKTLETHYLAMSDDSMVEGELDNANHKMDKARDQMRAFCRKHKIKYEELSEKDLGQTSSLWLNKERVRHMLSQEQPRTRDGSMVEGGYDWLLRQCARERWEDLDTIAKQLRAAARKRHLPMPAVALPKRLGSPPFHMPELESSNKSARTGQSLFDGLRSMSGDMNTDFDGSHVNAFQQHYLSLLSQAAPAFVQDAEAYESAQIPEEERQKASPFLSGSTLWMVGGAPVDKLDNRALKKRRKMIEQVFARQIERENPGLPLDQLSREIRKRAMARNPWLYGK